MQSIDVQPASLNPVIAIDVTRDRSHGDRPIEDVCNALLYLAGVRVEVIDEPGEGADSDNSGQNSDCVP